MKTGMNLLLWGSHVTEQHIPLLERLKRTGFDGVEIPIFEGDESHYLRLGEQLKRLGLACSTLTVMSPEHSLVSADAAVRKAAMERLKWIINMTAAVGGDVLCGPVHASLGAFTGTAPTEDERSRAAEGLRAAGEYAAKHDIRIAVEFLCRFETYFLTTAHDAANLVKRVNHPNVGMMWDTFHANIEEKHPPQALSEVARQVIHVHISENDRGTPGSGHVQWRETFAALKHANYDGWLTIEAFGRVLPELAAATRVWRDFFPSDRDVYERGFAFIKSMWTGTA